MSDSITDVQRAIREKVGGWLDAIEKEQHGDQSAKTVSFTDLWKWAGFKQKCHAKRMLLQRLVESRDYEVLSQKGENPLGGRPTEEILLTVDAAKKFLLKAQTPQGDAACDYFIQCEREWRLLKLETLVVRGTNIHARTSDGKVNVTELCAAGNKRLNDYMRLKHTQEFLQVLSVSAGIPVDMLTAYEINGSTERATWAHPQVAINIAQWVSAEFDVQVSRWIYELAACGSVALGTERADAEINKAWREKCDKLQRALADKERDLYEAVRKYERLKERRLITKFRPTKAFYITQNIKEQRPSLKIGITDDINTRLATYRTNAPYTKLLYLVYVEENKLLEDSVKCIFRQNLTPSNHELLSGIDVETVIEETEKCLQFLRVPYIIETERIALYNRDVESDFACEFAPPE